MRNEFQHQFVEAYYLMEYASEDGTEREVLWNSRDGVTPFTIFSAETGALISHVLTLHYDPLHVPKVGDRIFVDLTEQRGRVLAAARLERWLAPCEKAGEDTGPTPVQDLFESREHAVQHLFESTFRPDIPDILVVTAGYLEQLSQDRRERMNATGSALPFARVLQGPQTQNSIGFVLSEPASRSTEAWAQPCPRCGRRAAPGVPLSGRVKREVRPGDFVVCKGCGELSRFAADYSKRPLTDADRAVCPPVAIARSESIKGVGKHN